MVEVEILGQVVTSQYGVLNTGAVLRTSEAFAKHLVEDCGAAKYRAKTSKNSPMPVTDAPQGETDDADAPAAAPPEEQGAPAAPAGAKPSSKKRK